MLNGIENWKNVTYKIEWFSEGVSLQEDRKEICGNLPKGGVNAQPCPGKGGEIVSRLSGESYTIGQWVRRSKNVKSPVRFHLEELQSHVMARTH